jgi:N6-adenosine-specific RNA methylase IME4
MDDEKRCQGSTYLFADRTKHSSKPIEMRQMIEKVSDQIGFNKIEIFARDDFEGWDRFGNELANTEDIESVQKSMF